MIEQIKQKTAALALFVAAILLLPFVILGWIFFVLIELNYALAEKLHEIVNK